MPERILVVVDETDPSLRGLQYALSLGERVQGSLYILVVSPQDRAGSSDGSAESEEVEHVLDQSIRAALEKAQSAGVSASYHRAFGSFVEESVAFAISNCIHLVILMGAGDGADPRSNRLAEWAGEIRARSGCRVLLVQP